MSRFRVYLSRLAPYIYTGFSKLNAYLKPHRMDIFKYAVPLCVAFGFGTNTGSNYQIRKHERELRRNIARYYRHVKTPHIM